MLPAPAVDNSLRLGDVQFKISQRHSLFVAQKRSGLDAQQNLVRLLVFVAQIVRIAGDDGWNIELGSQFDELVVDAHLFVPFARVVGVAVILHLYVVTVAKYLLIPRS